MLNKYAPNGESVDVTADVYKVKITVLTVFPTHIPILYVDANAYPNKLDLELAVKSGTYEIKAGFNTNPPVGTGKKLNKVLKLQENPNPHIARFIFFNDDIKDPYIIIEMSDTP